LATSTFAFASILQADALTNTTDRYISGALDQRLIELGKDKSNGATVISWKEAYLSGVQRHCRFTLAARHAGDVSACDRK
jgi:hypothetical protein